MLFDDLMNENLQLSIEKNLPLDNPAKDLDRN